MGTLSDEGGGRWKLTVYLGRDATGRKHRTARRFSAKGKREAQTLARRLEDQLIAEATSSKGTLAEATETWWALWRARDRSPTTREGYRSVIDQHILRSPLAARQVRDLKVGDFDRWYADIGRGRSVSMVRRVNVVVSQVLDQCIRDGHLGANPAALARKPEQRAKKRPHTPVGEVRAILAAAHARSPVRARALAFAALTGLRRGEMAGVRWSRLDLTTGVLIVEWNVVTAARRFVGDPPKKATKDDRVHERVEKDPKAHQVAAIALGEQATELARQQIQWQIEEAPRAGVEPVGDPWLWQVRPPFGEPLWPATLSHWMIDARKAAGCDKVRLHDLRHWQASSMLETGATVEDVRERLRHRSISTTMGYLEADRSKQAGFVALLPQLQLPVGP